MKKIIKLICVAWFFVSTAAFGDISGEGIGSIYRATDKNNFKLDLGFDLDFDVNIFQFQEEELNLAKERINRALIDFANKEYADYKETFKSFMEELSEGIYTGWGYKNCLEIFYDVHTNNDNLFSIMIYSRKTGGGGNGCRTYIKGFNYILKDNPTYVLNLCISDIIRDDNAYLLLLEKINIKLAQRDSPLKAKLNHLFDSIEFAFAKDELIINFRGYSIGSGADCIVETSVAYSELKDILSDDILELLNIDFREKLTILSI